MKKVFLITGHTHENGGAMNLQTKETENGLVYPILSLLHTSFKNYETVLLSRHLSINEKCRTVNRESSPDDVALSFHLDSSGERKEKGAFIYSYGKDERREQAKKIIDFYCLNTGIANKGHYDDTRSRFGSLGIIRYIKCPSFLIELGSINNDLEEFKKFGRQAIEGLFTQNII